MFRVSGLATDLALSLTIGRRRLGRLDDVRGRGLGRRRGILPRRRELLLESARPWPQAQRAAPPIADNSDKTSVPWLSWLAMLNHRPQFRHNCTGERLPLREPPLLTQAGAAPRRRNGLACIGPTGVLEQGVGT